ncbi:MAG: ABC transporter substrate-binding protein [Actinomycetota bacterium]
MKRWTSLVAVLVLVLAACTGETEDTATTDTAAPPDTEAEESTTTTAADEGEDTTTTAAEDGEGDGAAEADGTVIIGTTDTIASLDPADAYAIHDWELLKNINEGLLRWTPGELELATGLATDMPEVSEDGLTYTLTLQEGVQFSDGTELTASMYAEQLNRLLTIGPDCPNGVANALATPFVESIEAPDESTIEFTLTRPVAYFPELLATAAYQPAHPDTFPADECVTFPEAPVHGTGPWYVTDYTQGEQTVLEPNPNYTGELTPQVDQIIIRYFSDPQTMALAVENGEIDAAWRILGAELVSELEGTEGLSVGTVEGGSIRYLVLNYAQEPMDDINVRKAVAAALDRNEIVDVVYGGQVEPLYSMVPPGFLGANEAFDALYLGPDPDAAVEFMAESGYDEDNPLELEMWYPPEHYGANTADWMQVIEQQLEATGVFDVTLEAQEWSTYIATLTGGEAYPAGVLGWFFDYPDPSNYMEPFVLNGGLGTRVTSPEGEPVNDQAAELVSMLEEASVEQDEDTRAQMYEEIQELYADLVVTLPILFESEHIVYNETVSGSDEFPSTETLNIGPNLEFYYSVLSES